MAPEEFLAAFDDLPRGAYGGTYESKRYRVMKSVLVTGRSEKLEAEELGGPDYICFNLYRLASGEVLLKPYDMPADKVIAFVLGLAAD